jgi:cyclophilin family peptidyl-prolyl cis-trans isomerase
VGTYSVFGTVTEGTDVIDEIATVPVNDPNIGVPLDAVEIESIVISGPDSDG